MPGGLRDLAVFPLNAVLLPGGLLRLKLFEQRYLAMAKACLKDDAPFGVCLIREGQEVGAPASYEPVGCLARIEQWDMPQLGVLQVAARGGARFRVVSGSVQADGLARAQVELLGEAPDAPPAPAERPCVQLLERVLTQLAGAWEEPTHYDSSAWVSGRLAELLPLPRAVRQQLLELGGGPARLARLQALLTRDDA